MARHWLTASIAILLIAVAAPGSAAADDAIAEAARAVEQKAAVGQFDEAWTDLKALETLIWEKRPLGIDQALFVSTPATGYGLYEPREKAAFNPGEPLYVYLQPVGYRYERVDGAYRVALTADFELRTPGGQVLAEQEGFSRLSLESRAPNREFQTSFSFTFDGLDAGRYELVIRIRDEKSGQRSEIGLPFTVVQAEPAEPAQ